MSRTWAELLGDAEGVADEEERGGFLARPCPFYILDEVEAALDDINIDRFLQLVRRYSLSLIHI